MTHIDTQAMCEQKVFTSESSECFLQKLSLYLGGLYGYRCWALPGMRSSVIRRLPSLFSDSLMEVTVMGYQMKRTITLTKKKNLDRFKHCWKHLGGNKQLSKNM